MGIRGMADKISHNILLPFASRSAGTYTGYDHDIKTFKRAAILFYCFGINGSPTTASVTLTFKTTGGTNTNTNKQVVFSTTDGTLNLSGTTERTIDLLFGVDDYTTLQVEADVSFTGGTSPTMNIGCVVVFYDAPIVPVS